MPGQSPAMESSVTTKTLVGYAGMTVGGWLGWWLGDLVGIVTAVVVSGVFSGVGLYAARKWAEYYLE
jgi:hypothetical protein